MEEKIPTGTYSAYFEDRDQKRYDTVNFKIEAYKVPKFMVELHGKDKVSLDQEFKVSLSARYYAGGDLAGRPLIWRISQFPYTWNPPKGLKEFSYSSDGRYSGGSRFVSTSAQTKQENLDDKGTSEILINPAMEETSQPRIYMIEATVTGADDQTVTATKSVITLPPFILGLKTDRYIKRTKEIATEIICVDPDGKFIKGQKITVRLINRQWHSHLQKGDFSEGIAKYISDIVDKKILEKEIVSGGKPIKLTLPISRSGVYVVEIESHDKLGRAQVVSLDLYAGGEEPISWEKPVSNVFKTSTDKKDYNPGDQANIVLKSPFQNARVLAVIEAPDRNEYKWIDVKGGSATFTMPILKNYISKIPVHFILMRGRLKGTSPIEGLNADPGKPVTMASTEWVYVNPVENRLEIDLDYPKKALPGQTIDVKLNLRDTKDKPLSGEVTLWLVDQAVLALGREKSLDPLPDFIPSVYSSLNFHDTRNLSLGYLPLLENPGGDVAFAYDMLEEEMGARKKGILDKATIRKDFRSVPYFNPEIIIDSSGKKTIRIKLPDNLTNFKIRAKAVSGEDRFGYNKGIISVRLPVIVQPALPRFVRPGDTFTASAIGRIVEGEGGPGAASVKTKGVTVYGETDINFVWEKKVPKKLEYNVSVPTPPYDEKGKLSYNEVTFSIGIERLSDKAIDAFSVKLPIRDDRKKAFVRKIENLKAGKNVLIPEIFEEARPGTIKRTILISDQPALIHMASGLDFLLNYPYGCTEQRVSRARAQLALKKFRKILQFEGDDTQLDKSVDSTLEWIYSSVNTNGLVGYWPGSNGYVSLTAWVVQFIIEAKNEGYDVNEEVYSKLLSALENSLRSDYSYFIDGESYAERTWALNALTAAGRFNQPYASELGRKANYLNLEGKASVLHSVAYFSESNEKTISDLKKMLWDGLIIRLYKGKEIYGGLQTDYNYGNRLILPSETRTIAKILRGLKRSEDDNKRIQLLINALTTLGTDTGWGTTNANAAALLVLSEIFNPPFKNATPHKVSVNLDNTVSELNLNQDSPMQSFVSNSLSSGTLMLEDNDPSLNVVAKIETSYIPLPDGSNVIKKSKGFVVTRELQLIKDDKTPPIKIPIEKEGVTINFTVGDIVEEHISVVNPKDRHYVAIVAPLAAGMEPMNPNLETSPPEAKTIGALTLAPSYTSLLDHHAAYYYDTLPKGTYDFYFRTKATTPGRFIQPPALSEMMYNESVFGNSPGAKIEIQKRMGEKFNGGMGK